MERIIDFGDVPLAGGFLPKGWRAAFEGQQTIWVHAVSVGEVLTVCGFIEKLQARFPSKKIVCSVVTRTGYALAQARLRDQAHVIYAPLDFSWVVKKYVHAIAPCVYIAAETEIWPNLYAALEECSIPVIQINGRISDKSFKGYKRLSFLFKSSLAAVKLCCMQSRQDAQRIISIGVAADRVQVLGNLKFDGQIASKASTAETASLLKGSKQQNPFRRSGYFATASMI